MVKRLAFFIYGCLAYLVFVATFLYAIGFVGGFVVPTQLDGPPRAPLGPSLAIDAGLLALFAVQHSVMARRWFKKWWNRMVPHAIERSTHVLCASLSLHLLFWQWRPWGTIVWSVDNAPAQAALWALFGYGWAMVLVATFLINHFDLFGLRQVWLQLNGTRDSDVTLRERGSYRTIRYPLYFGFLLALWATPTMTLPHLVFGVATAAYILIAIQLEERDLVVEHGIAYHTHRRRVPMLVPLAPARLATRSVREEDASTTIRVRSH